MALLSMPVLVAGPAEGRGTDTVPGQETLLWRVQVPKMQEKMDVGQQLGKSRAGLHKVSPQCLPTQAGNTYGRNFSILH